MLKNSRILITGGAGFIGSHLVEKLLATGNAVNVYDNFDEYYTGKEKNLAHLKGNKHFKLTNADILNYDELLNASQSADMVFHLAAQPGVRFSIENPLKTTTVNIIGTLNVLKAAKNTGVKKLIFASSSSVYGEPKYTPINEKHPTEPISIYGASKLAGEKYCQVFNDPDLFPIVMLRFHTVYGPRQRPDLAIYKWTKALLENQPVTIYGDGEQTRDFTFIDDIIDGAIRAAEIEGDGGEIFNLGGGNNVSVNETIRLLAKITNSDSVKIIHESSKTGDVTNTHADVTKAEKMIGFRPKTRLEAGLRQYVEWFKKNSWKSG